MKEYQKLAKEYGSGMFAHSFSVNPIVIGYEAGFKKAREMAIESLENDGTVLAMSNLGEKDAE